MPYKDPVVGKQKAAERNARRWLEIKADPVRLEAHRAYRAKIERQRRAKDPHRGVGREQFLADAQRHKATRKARKLNQFIEPVDRRIVYEMHGGMCGICKEFIEGDFHVDHVIPLSKGGMHGYVNVQPAHPLCNWKKNDFV